MVTIECPFCDEAVRMDADVVRCDACAVELEFTAEPTAAAIAIAA
jgi:hypothetical protein